MGWFIRTFWTLAGGGAVYIAAICALTVPWIQRKATYVYDANPTIFQNLSNVDQFGFLHHQVQAFTIETGDGHKLFAWHILPAHLYHKHETRLKAQSGFGKKSFEQAAQDVGLQLLLNDPSAYVVISFHGNAGHIASSCRPATYQQYLGTSTPERPVHVIAFDYRGFGLSTGIPDEEGVIQDGLTLLSALTGKQIEPMHTVEKSSSLGRYLRPDQIILAGQSMGTFISTAVYHSWTLRLKQPALKGLMLFASFSSLPKLLDSYSIKGITPPLLSPIAGYPWLQRWFMSNIVDKWDTASRLKELVQATDVPLDLTIMHAHDDWDIPWREGRRNWEAVTEAAAETGSLELGADTTDPNLETALWADKERRKRVKWEKVRHGGHNRIPTSEHAKVALLELLERGARRAAAQLT